MNSYIVQVLLLLSTFACFGQTESIVTEIKAENVYQLSIIKVLPDSFPEVSVIFQAKNKFGKPLWTLDKSEIRVSENQLDCTVLQLLNISENKPLNIGLVFDHSGSMIDNPAQMPEGVESMQNQYLLGLPIPKDYVMAITYAKEGVIEFLDQTEVVNDSILFTGFSTTVDKVFPLTNDISEIKSFVEKVEPGGGTAFYDALYVSIENLSISNNKSVLIALTDGLDNESKHTYEDVITYANEKEISIYTIGLGNVNPLLLRKISEETDGFYYHTNDPEKLKEIYLNIKDQIRSIYQVDYTSDNLDYTEIERDIHFSFINDTLEFSHNNTQFYLPEETISYLQAKEEERRVEKRNKLLLGGIGIVTLGLGSFMVYRRRKKPLSIKKFYPNPFIDELSLKYQAPSKAKSITIKVFDVNGKRLLTTQLENTGGTIKLMLAHLNAGTYLIQIQDDSNTSETIKIIKE